MAELIVKVRRFGRVLGVEVPPDVAAAEGIKEGTSVIWRITKVPKSARGRMRGPAPLRHEGDWGHD